MEARGPSKMSIENELEKTQDEIRASFENADRVRSFDQFLEGFLENPRLYLRPAHVYLLDMLESLGRRSSSRIGQPGVSFAAFEKDFESGEALLVGHERVQEEIHRNLIAFAKRGRADKMLLLHGPNGSGKTTIVDCLVRGQEYYSRTDEGVLLKFNWVFAEKEGRLDRIGFEKELESLSDATDTYAFLDPKDTAAKIHCELRDPPIFLIPKDRRRKIIEEAIAKCPEEKRPRFPYTYFLEGDLCQKCRKIHDALLVAYQGDWRKVLRHVQVERFYVSRRYRTGAVSIEPQGNVDAGVRAVQSEHSWSIPPILKNLSLYEPYGDIVDANHGLLEYSDFLKRPIEVSKYLLTTCERGTINVANCVVYLDLVIVGTTNEKQLSFFKRSSDFSSFKARMELIPVPYLLRVSRELALYQRHVTSFSRERHVTPHSSRVAALWAVLTRLRKPDPKDFQGPLSTAVQKLTPVEKAYFYDTGDVPARLTEDEKKALKAGILRVRQEFEEAEGEFEGVFGAEYEGRRGASAREMMSILALAAGTRKHSCLTPMAIFDALEDLLKDASLYDFLRIAADGPYHDVRRFLDDVRREHFQWVTEEVYDAINLVDESEYDRFFLEYFRHVKAFHTHEKVYDSRTNSYEPPREDLMQSVEAAGRISEPREAYRSQVIMRIAAWSLDHPHVKIDYQQLFPEIHAALKERFHRERDRLLTLIERDMLKHGTDEFKLLRPAEQEQVERALASMKSKYNYCEECARDVIAYVLKCRPEMEEASR